MNYWYVKDVAKLYGVSIKLLHHWDKVGVICPSHRLPNGYRLYNEADLEKLQKALVYRETGMSLESIKSLLHSPKTEEEHLHLQLDLLQKSMDDLKFKIRSVKKLLEEHMKNKTLTAEQKMKIMGMPWISEWEKEAEEKWGNTEDWQNMHKNLANVSSDDWVKHQQKIRQIETDLSALCQSETSPDSAEAIELTEKYRLLMSEHHFPITHSKHVILARLYNCDHRFKSYYDSYCPNFSHWLRLSIEANAKKHGIAPQTAKWE